jgi:uncharacterized protein (TIGR03067 family)
MRSALGCLVLLVATLALVAAPSPKEKPKVQDEDAILGIWALVKMEDAAGIAPPEDELLNCRHEFRKEGKLKVTQGPNGEVTEAQYKLDASAKVKTLDMIEEKQTSLCIYQLDGDTLKICVAVGPKGKRPQEMKPNGTSTCDPECTMVLTMKRLKD